MSPVRWGKIAHIFWSLKCCKLKFSCSGSKVKSCGEALETFLILGLVSFSKCSLDKHPTHLGGVVSDEMQLCQICREEMGGIQNILQPRNEEVKLYGQNEFKGNNKAAVSLNFSFFF